MDYRYSHHPCSLSNAVLILLKKDIQLQYNRWQLSLLFLCEQTFASSSSYTTNRKPLSVFVEVEVERLSGIKLGMRRPCLIHLFQNTTLVCVTRSFPVTMQIIIAYNKEKMKRCNLVQKEALVAYTDNDNPAATKRAMK